MTKIYSNGPNKDYVIKPFEKLLMKSKEAFLAAPYFTLSDPLLKAIEANVSIKLIIGLNQSTNPKAISNIFNKVGISIRFYTHRFHAKIYIFDNEVVLLGSSNLTDGGLISNREAVVSLDTDADGEAVDEVNALFSDLWENAQVLTPEALSNFKLAWNSIDRSGESPDLKIEKKIGRSEPKHIGIESGTKSKEKIFLQGLRREVYEQYKPSFTEICEALTNNDLRRSDCVEFPLEIEVNRFLNWVRLTKAPGDEAWQTASLRAPDERTKEVCSLGREWVDTDDSRIYDGYYNGVKSLQHTFSSIEAINHASRDEISGGLLGVHAFYEQLRFVKGGEKNLPNAFWASNNNDVKRVKKSISLLLYGPGDFIERFHDILYSRHYKLGMFGYFCGLELFGTIRPDICPPMNGRMAKSLRFIGYDVRPR